MKTEKERISITIDRKILSKIDKVRGLIPRATWINEKLKEMIPAEPSKAPAGKASTQV